MRHPETAEGDPVEQVYQWVPYERKNCWYKNEGDHSRKSPEQKYNDSYPQQGYDQIKETVHAVKIKKSLKSIADDRKYHRKFKSKIIQLLLKMVGSIPVMGT